MSGANSADARFQASIDALRRAYASGQRAAASRALETARAAAARDPERLNELAGHVMAAGDPGAARALLEQSLALDAVSPECWINLAHVCNALGDAPAELGALERALALDPGSTIALLQKGALLERQGRAREAAATYHAAVLSVPANAQPGGVLARALDHACKVVEADKAALERFLAEYTREVRAQHASEPLERYERCLATLLGKTRVYVQQPTFMHFPHLPAIQFYDRKEFPWLAALDEAAPAIREELLQVIADDHGGFIPYVDNPDGVPALDQWRELNRSLRWSAYYLFRDGLRIDEHCAKCPKTAQTLQAMPLLDVPGRAPTAFFSLLRPGTHIPPHTGVSNTRLIVHLPLVVPEGCRFRVGSETRAWRAGESLVFDDTIEHEAWNESDAIRTVLIFDIWNPYLSAPERDLVRTTMQGVEAFYAKPA